ncbi:multicopper oxidase domain-containing protein [Thalassotalea sp. ND16A]|uniref:multicopper oxidase domain-containing protein n=1 Tax=Thalassotalea sp. ND16A TaxID=1535422 RepID=UPI00051CED8D|nr:multicopper oxidase domain-containing protein [Thalassotalea sp. ND16A]KGJ91585.1 hypothetical protein ND16A_1817 [Thalassotalea sp. ND16A]
MKIMSRGLSAAMLLLQFVVLTVSAQGSALESNIYVQCPTTTELHPSGNGIQCRHLLAGDGMVTMADDAGKQQYIFSYAELPQGDPNEPPINTSEYAGWVVEQGMLAANAPAPTISVDEDDELFLTLSNVGMAMRPDLFDPHTIHWHGFPNAAAIFDGVPDASISVNMMASLTYYYYAKDAGTYMYHCHVEAAEHMQMGCSVAFTCGLDRINSPTVRYWGAIPTTIPMKVRQITRWSVTSTPSTMATARPAMTLSTRSRSVPSILIFTMRVSTHSHCLSQA